MIRRFALASSHLPEHLQSFVAAKFVKPLYKEDPDLE
jgi:hypothetical protein